MCRLIMETPRFLDFDDFNHILKVPTVAQEVFSIVLASLRTPAGMATDTHW